MSMFEISGDTTVVVSREDAITKVTLIKNGRHVSISLTEADVARLMEELEK